MDDIIYNQLMMRVKNLALQTSLLFTDTTCDSPYADETPEKVLKKVFGYKTFRPMQREIIQNILDGRDTLAVMPTGGGKSLCYQIPALIMNGLTVVVSPLISLMQDQVSQLEANGINAVYINSSLEFDDYRKACSSIRNGKTKLLYVSPEGLNTSRMQDLLHSDNVQVNCITIDEAHCISEWGHNFRPDYLEIANVRRQFPNAVCLALTATATAQVRRDIVANLRMENPAVLISSFNRPNIFLSVKKKENPNEQVLDFLERHKNESGIIYCFSRRQVDELTFFLRQHRIKVLNYHAGLTDSERTENQNAFIKDKVHVMVSTLAFGMGINKPDVRFVIHYDIPKSIEQYYQEIGRAGRDGLPSTALLLYSVKDIHKIRYFFKDSPDPQNAERLLHFMTDYAESSMCRRRKMLCYFGEQNMPSQESESCCDICAGITSGNSNAPVMAFPKPTKAKSAPRPAKKTFSVSDIEGAESERIYTELKAWRKKTADEENIPPYIIFGDKTLIDLAKRKPQNNSELLECYGIGSQKAEKFGSQILRIVRG